ncbi:MAG TPA: glycoside hydrolase family 43 protein [Baekduia sp.]
MEAVRRLGLILVALVLSAATYTNPVIPGDHPDPTIVRSGDQYLASATTSAWAPVFPIYRSRDLVNWTQVGAVLAQPPPWASGKFWAPELQAEPGRILAYWGAARHGGTPCIALSTAARATGPWHYRGRVTCPPGGAIDAQPFRDADGSRWLLWKAAGTQGIMIQRLDSQGLTVRGPPHRLLAPTAPWEQHVTEGPSLIRTGGRYLLFYSGGHCCSLPCSYAEGVAVATHIEGPYMKDPDNPVLRDSPAWKCPGHGTVIKAGGAGLVLLHHAFRADDVFNVRRQVLLDRVTLGPDGWPVVGGSVDVADSPTGVQQQPPATGFSDGFAFGLQQGWEWLFDTSPTLTFGGGDLTQTCDGPLRFVARQTVVDRLTATATVEPPTGRASIGLALNLGRGVRGIEVGEGRVRAFTASPTGAKTGPSIPAPPGRIQLVVSLIPGGRIATYVGQPGGPLRRINAGPATQGAAPTRLALTCRGSGSGRFASARVRAE